MPISEEQLLEWIKDFDSKNRGAQHLTYYYKETQEELYGKNATIKRQGRIFGSYHSTWRRTRGMVTFAYGNIRDETDFRETIYHEIYGHYGTLTFSREEKRRLLETIRDSRQSPSMVEYWMIIDKDYFGEDESIKSEEMFCLIAEACSEKSSKNKNFDEIWNDIVIHKKRLLTIQDLEIICDAVAYGIRTGEREQQIFPKNDRSQYRFEGDEEKEHQYKLALSMLNINLDILKNDSRFSKHTLDELKQIAFYREIYILEKENARLNPNADEFDLKMTDRNIVAHLPKITQNFFD